MSSFDVESLFTNIPLNETIDIVITKLFNNSPSCMKFTHKPFKDLLELAIKKVSISI